MAFLTCIRQKKIYQVHNNIVIYFPGKLRDGSCFMIFGILGLCRAQGALAPVPGLLPAGRGVRGQRQHRDPGGEGRLPPDYESVVRADNSRQESDL